MSEPAASKPRFPDLTLADLVAELVWPGLLRAGTLALAPSRLLLATGTIILIGLIGSLSRIWSDVSFGTRAGDVLGQSARQIGAALGSIDLARPWEIDLAALWAGIASLAFGTPGQLLTDFPVSTFVLGIPMIVVALVGWCAIARSAAWEFGIHASEGWTTCLTRSIQRAPALVAVVLGPPVVVGLIALGMGALGWVLLGLPAVNVVGAVLWGLTLFVAVVTVLLTAAWAAGSPMLAPAVACEGPDAFDAIQRAMAYVIGKPLRYLVYVGLLAAVGALLTTLLALVLRGGDELATRATAMFLAEEHAAIVLPHGSGTPELEGTAVAAGRIVAFWRSMLTLALGSFVLSYFASSSAVLYLVMRRLNDGQDVGDLGSEIDA